MSTPRFWHSKQLSLNKFFDPSTPSMRKGNSGELRKRAEESGEKTDENSGHYVIAAGTPHACAKN